MIDLKKISEFDHGFKTKEYAREILMNEDHGAFLLRYSEDRKRHVVSSWDKDKKEVLAYEIKEQKINNKDYFWIEQADFDEMFHRLTLILLTFSKHKMILNGTASSHKIFVIVALLTSKKYKSG